ncbi:ABC transporter permease [Deminuibacter soli]|uniref:ABC transporter permease n=1 Tax=Deminuibacter soli TaxID=2291815 RepID=A0A3E1NDE0_9BACT|nr:ABC transporter permease [Deminuibacter soli]RFM25887.1 ABC transporter permease [Deminuibacter soli]
MLRNFLKTAWRNLLRHKTDSLINIVGLCVAFTCALLLFLSVFYEYSYDHFQRNGKDIYQLYFTDHKATGTERGTSMPMPLYRALSQAYPAIKYIARHATGSAYVRYKDKVIDEKLLYTDAAFFSMFSFPLLKGEKNTVLKSPNAIVLREKIAKAIFGEEDAMGKMIELKQGSEWKPFVVSGVGGEFPDNTTVGYDIAIPFENHPEAADRYNSWDNQFFSIFVQLNNQVSAKAFEQQLPPFVHQHYAESIKSLKRDGGKPDKNGEMMTLNLLPLFNLHTNTEFNNVGASISASYLYLLLAIGILIVVIACINFINLSIGRSLTRSREIGLRKTLGANRSQIMLQLWGEAFLLCLIALVLSCLLCWLLLPGYKQLFRMNIEKSLLLQPGTWLYTAAGFLVVTLLAGVYPAWVMGRLRIVNILKGSVSVSRSGRLRNGLIVLQFGIAIFLITCTLVSWKQINYLRTQPLGFNTSQVISIPVNGQISGTAAEQLLRQKLAARPEVLSVSGIYNNLGRGKDNSSMSSRMGFDYNNHTVVSHWYGVSYDFVKTLDLQVTEGRDFSRSLATDSAGVVINEAMAAALNDKDLIGKFLPLDNGKLQILGIVKNFNFQSLHNKVEPLTLVLNKEFGVNYILVKVQPANPAGSMELLKSAWKEIAPGSEFLGSFLDENVNAQYRNEERLTRIFVIGAVITIVLSCMGLLAMVILIVSQRVKEIGIRKVLGASVNSLVQLVAKDFIVLVLVAAFIAFPIAWYFMHNWLLDFAYRASISWWIFAVAAALAIVIAYATIGLQAFKAAMRNPVKSLRSE